MGEQISEARVVQIKAKWLSHWRKAMAAAAIAVFCAATALVTFGLPSPPVAWPHVFGTVPAASSPRVAASLVEHWMKGLPHVGSATDFMYENFKSDVIRGLDRNPTLLQRNSGQQLLRVATFNVHFF